MSIKYVHTNLIAKDWINLSQFYINVFNCHPIYPPRDLNGKWIDKLTGISNVEIQGIHLLLPGFDEYGPTLEIFQYSSEFEEAILKHINSPGFAHIAFHVDSVEEYADRIIDFGGSLLGEIIKKEIENIGILTAVYAKDPEGNIIEIQNWEKDNNE